MTAPTLTRERTLNLQVREDDQAPGVVRVLAVPFGETLSMWGGMFHEEVSPDVTVQLRDAQSLPILWRHDEVIGSWSKDLTRTSEGLEAVGRISDTTLGRDVLTLLRDQASTGASIGFRVVDSHQETRDEQTVDVLDTIELLEISLTPIPAYSNARVVSVREQNGDTMPTPETGTVDLAPVVREALTPITERLDQIEARAFANPTPDAHWSTQYRSAYEYACAVWHGKDETRALDTGLTGDNGGLVVAQWLREVQKIIDRGRPGIQAFGTAPLPSSGMSFSWPTYTAGAHVAAQPTGQANELTSVAVDIAMSSAVNIGTYGGAMRAAFQLLERSDPAYAPLWNQAMAAAYNNVTDNVFVDALTAGADDGSETVFDFDSGSETGATFRSALFAASVDVETATGMPAEFCLVASDVFKAVGGYSGLPDPGYGAGANAEGVSSARTLRLEVSGIQVIHDRNLANGSILVSNSSAAKWHEAGPFFVSQDQVGVLARDVAIYGYGVTAQYLSTGVVNLKASYA